MKKKTETAPKEGDKVQTENSFQLGFYYTGPICSSFSLASDVILRRIKVLSNFESVHLGHIFRQFFTIANILTNIFSHQLPTPLFASR